MLELVLEAIAEIIGQALLELVLKPFHWLAWGTGVALFAVGAFGRFQIEPFAADDEWLPEEGRPILYTAQATTVGIGAWIILGAVIVRQFLL